MYEIPKSNPNIYATTGTPAGVLDTAQPSRVQSAQNMLDQNVAELHQALGELERRLCSVLGPTKPEGVGEPSTPPATVAARIESSARGVANAGQRVADLINRLEL